MQLFRSMRLQVGLGQLRSKRCTMNGATAWASPVAEFATLIFRVNLTNKFIVSVGVGSMYLEYHQRAVPWVRNKLTRRQEA